MAAFSKATSANLLSQTSGCIKDEYRNQAAFALRFARVANIATKVGKVVTGTMVEQDKEKGLVRWKGPTDA